jgi:hypothetical protein
LKEEALDRIKWRNRFGRDCGGPVVWQITDEWMNYVCWSVSIAFLCLAVQYGYRVTKIASECYMCSKMFVAAVYNVAIYRVC